MRDPRDADAATPSPVAEANDGSKIDIDPHKRNWHPSLLIGQIVVVSSRSIHGEPNAAAKTWITMVCSDPPMIALSCRLSHRTAINILETREFVVNIPGEDSLERAIRAGDSVASMVGPRAEWTFLRARRVAAPRIRECRGHLECVLDSTHRLHGEECVFFAKIVAASADRSLVAGPPPERYGDLRPIFFLEEGLVSVLDRCRGTDR